MRTLALTSLLAFASVISLASAQETPLPEPQPPKSSPPEPQPAALQQALRAVRDAPSAERSAAIDGVLALEPSRAAVTALIDAGLSTAPIAAGWHVLSATDEGGVGRPYHLYIPAQAVAPAEPAPLLIDMHGGVARPVFIDEEQFAQFRNTWNEIADEYGIVVAMPLGRADCMWWSDAGVAHVRAVVRDVQRRARVDSDRVVATGFSDGGSGCYYLAMAAPGPFAALLPMNGHPMVAVGASERQLYLRNATLMPLFVCMTADDGLYPAQSVLPHIQALIGEGAPLHLVSYPTGGHSPSYFDDQAEAFAGFIVGARRDPLPDALEWAAAHLEIGAVAWAEITEIGAGQGDAPADVVPDVQVMSVAGRVLLGIGVDPDYAGPGVHVTSVDDRRPSGALGLQVGDIVVRVDDAEIASLADLRAALGRKRFGDELTVAVVRDGAAAGPVVTSTTIPAFTPEPSYSREQATAWFTLKRDGNTVNVVSRGIRGLRLSLSEAQFDFANEVAVVVNGVERRRVKPTADLRLLLEGWARTGDSGRLFSATLDVIIPAADASK